ncbi:hypothetical protein DCC39_12250 [Pueribacillus theae]|uniref:DUF3817 domain-containing protein n=1 Tax=Pueribacillus theae TaxID=2171751 RepID=A0A2U1JX81_9BACI|nr:DUF3817 domain-containing protein [Pueribacillus theae]PWA09732.1 hypothetical protein DCC39_12250 [Pueribacillus theae]
MFKNALKQFRVLGILEGSSLLVLLFIAMPLKYFMDMPEAVSVFGMIHGILFTVYCVAIIYAAFAVRWPFRFTIGAFVAAFIPFGNFILDSRLKLLETN